jgi:hypothetical protein
MRNNIVELLKASLQLEGLCQQKDFKYLDIHGYFKAQIKAAEYF